jgi:hypothetical protein
MTAPRAKLMHNSGYVSLYYTDCVNHCPGCGKTHWHIGRTTAECAFCETAMSLAVFDEQPPSPLFYTRGSKTCNKTTSAYRIAA